MRQVLLFSFAIAMVTMSVCQAQSDSTIRQRKNIIKVNLTANILYSQAPLFEYERIIKPYQSISVQAGFVALPFGSGLDSDRFNFKSNLKKTGYTFTIDYRFYLPKENRDPAPHGIYLAPYFSMYHFKNESNIEFKADDGTTEPVSLTSKINVMNIGVELGYQFVLGKGKRWTIDCIIFGPSYSNYYGTMNLEGDLSDIELDETAQEILKDLVDKYPLIGDFLNEEIIKFNGKLDAWTLGFRYSIHVGFRF